ncbi:MAG: Cytochrome [Massilia sp.]|jgi:cytochrome c553|nr:Cytochrome [Massilia sp.]
MSLPARLPRLTPLILALALGCAAALPAFAADRPAVLPDSMEQRVIACTSCHAKTGGTDAFFPRISGKPAGYLYNQLINFRDGRRQYPLMTYMVENLPDAYLREIADYFSTQHLPPPPVQPTAVSQAVLARGQMLVTRGDKAIGVPACIACHGERLTGVAPAIPGLAGLPRDYVNAQFGAWKNKTRRAHAPDCMADIANRLSLDDVAAVSSWIGARPLPADTAPAAAVTRPLPLACGSSPDRAS